MDRIKEQQENKLHIGQWTVIPLENCLVKADQKVVVIPKVMDLLLFFCSHPNQVISIQLLSEAVWPNEFVGDNAIYNLIGQLRKALGDNAAKPHYIETLSKKGYRLIAEVTHTSFNNTSKSLSSKSNIFTSNSAIKKWLVICLIISAGVLLYIYLASFFMPNPKLVTAPLSLAEQQYSLGQFHLNKGQADNLNQAVNYFRKSLTVEPNNVPVMLDLGFAYLQLSYVEQSNHSAHANKALELAKNMQHLAPNNPNVLGLVHLTLSKKERKLSHQQWLTTYDEPGLTHRTLIAFSKVYFHQGRIDDAIKLQSRALSQCANCAYIYNALSTSQLLRGDLEQAFVNFQLSLELSDARANNSLHELGYSNLTISKLRATLKWVETSKIEHDSIHPKQRNPLALFYLSTRQVQKAYQLMQPVLHNVDNRFFTLYTLAAVYGAQKNQALSHAFFKKRMQQYPENKRFILSFVYSLWMSGKVTEALKLIQQTLLPNNDIKHLRSNTDTSLILLYGALLLENEQQEKGREVLTMLSKRFKQGLLNSSDQGNLGYAQTLALLGENELALKEIEMALAKGWVEDFNNNWWYLEDDPFFRGLLNMEQFNRLVEKHRKIIGSLFE